MFKNFLGQFSVFSCTFPFQTKQIVHVTILSCLWLLIWRRSNPRPAALEVARAQVENAAADSSSKTLLSTWRKLGLVFKGHSFWKQFLTTTAQTIPRYFQSRLVKFLGRHTQKSRKMRSKATSWLWLGDPLMTGSFSVSFQKLLIRKMVGNFVQSYFLDRSFRS